MESINSLLIYHKITLAIHFIPHKILQKTYKSAIFRLYKLRVFLYNGHGELCNGF